MATQSDLKRALVILQASLTSLVTQKHVPRTQGEIKIDKGYKDAIVKNQKVISAHPLFTQLAVPGKSHQEFADEWTRLEDMCRWWEGPIEQLSADEWEMETKIIKRLQDDIGKPVINESEAMTSEPEPTQTSSSASGAVGEDDTATKWKLRDAVRQLLNNLLFIRLPLSNGPPTTAKEMEQDDRLKQECVRYATEIRNSPYFTELARVGETHEKFSYDWANFEDFLLQWDRRLKPYKQLSQEEWKEECEEIRVLANELGYPQLPS